MQASGWLRGAALCSGDFHFHGPGDFKVHAGMHPALERVEVSVRLLFNGLARRLPREGVLPSAADRTNAYSIVLGRREAWHGGTNEQSIRSPGKTAVEAEGAEDKKMRAAEVCCRLLPPFRWAG